MERRRKQRRRSSRFHIILASLGLIAIASFQCVSLEDPSVAPPKKITNSTGPRRDDDELRLVTYLFKKYNKEVRPVKNKTIPVSVVFGIAYTQLIELDEKNQVMISNVWIRMKWENHFLTWNKDHFGGIKSINVDPKEVWLPDIVLYNNADETLASGQMDQFKTKVILSASGENNWYAPTILRSRCAIDIEYFPFDDQKCSLKFLSWTYDGLRVDVVRKNNTADLSSYLPSGEFEMISAKAERNIEFYSCCTEPYPNVEFIIHIRRKTLFYFNNLIVPCFLITALGLLTFVLPPATGERVTLVITTLLAMTVFMLMIAENTPTTSEVTPLIGKFFIASMVIIGLSLIATCIVLNLYECNRSVDSVPRWVRRLFMEILAPFLRVDPPKEKAVLKYASRSVDSVLVCKDDPHSDVMCVACPDKGGLNGRTTDGMDKWRTNDRGYDNDQQLRHRHATVPEKLAEGISILSERARQQERTEALAEEWQVVAKVADRFFLLIFILTIAATTSFIFLNRPDPPTSKSP